MATWDDVRQIACDLPEAVEDSSGRTTAWRVGGKAFAWERLLRRGVLWRKRSFGSQSADGCRFAERMLTAVQTLRLQVRPILAFLHDAIAAHRAGQPGPQLVVAG